MFHILNFNFARIEQHNENFGRADFSLVYLESHVYVVSCFRFYTLLVLSTALFGRPPFKNVIVNGLVLARLVCQSVLS